MAPGPGSAGLRYGDIGSAVSDGAALLRARLRSSSGRYHLDCLRFRDHPSIDCRGERLLYTRGFERRDRPHECDSVGREPDMTIFEMIRRHRQYRVLPQRDHRIQLHGHRVRVAFKDNAVRSAQW